MRREITKVLAWIGAMYAIALMLPPSAWTCSRDNFNIGEHLKIGLVERIVDLLSKSKFYDKQICSFQIKIGLEEIEIEDEAYAVFPYSKGIEFGIPEENIKEFQSLKDLNLSIFKLRLRDWEFYEYSPADQTGLIALMYNSKTKKMVFLVEA